MGSAHCGRLAPCLTHARNAPIIASAVVISSREDSNLQTELDCGGRWLSIPDERHGFDYSLRALRMNECFFAAVSVKIATFRAQAESVNPLRSVARFGHIACDATKPTVVFFDRPLSR